MNILKFVDTIYPNTQVYPYQQINYYTRLILNLPQCKNNQNKQTKQHNTTTTTFHSHSCQLVFCFKNCNLHTLMTSVSFFAASILASCRRATDLMKTSPGLCEEASKTCWKLRLACLKNKMKIWFYEKGSNVKNGLLIDCQHCYYQNTVILKPNPNNLLSC